MGITDNHKKEGKIRVIDNADEIIEGGALCAMVGWGFGLDEVETALDKHGWEVVKYKSDDNFSYSLIVLGPNEKPSFWEIRWSDYGTTNIDSVQKLTSVPLELDFKVSDLVSETKKETMNKLMKFESKVKELIDESDLNVSIYNGFFNE